MSNPVSILLVDDNLINVKVMSHSLKRLNCTIHTADNGLEAFELFKTNSYDVILMDIMMPVMDGFEATQKIREYEKENNMAKATPVIAVTANTLNNERQQCLDAGMNDFISKPIVLDKIIEVMGNQGIVFS